MILINENKKPKIHTTAYIAPTAVICSNAEIGSYCCILFGAVIVSESGIVNICSETIIMKKAITRSISGDNLSIGNKYLIGPNAYLIGCNIEDECFIAANAYIFNAAVNSRGFGVRIAGIVRINTELKTHFIVPIGWMAVSKLTKMYSPSKHDRYNDRLAELDFSKTVFRSGKQSDGYMDVSEVTSRHSQFLQGHSDNCIISEYE